MFKTVKKIFILVPCMIFALFLFNSTKVSATEASVINTKVVKYGENNENVYYFTCSDQWDVLISDIHVIRDWDTFLRYRVIRPNGYASPWSDKVEYPETDGKFTINAYSEVLSFKPQDSSSQEYVDMSSFTTIVEGATYFIEIKYYSSIVGFEKDQNKDEILKVVYNPADKGDMYTPKLNVVYDKVSKSYNVDSSIVDEKGKALSVVFNVQYMFTTEKYVMQKKSDFDDACKKEECVSIKDGLYKPSFDGAISEPTGEKKYLYVLSESANGYYEIKEINVNTKTEEGKTDKEKTPVTEDVTTNDTGLFDYDFGEFILLVLIIVLIVSCALIITQKIVDYKKRLY